jgi:alpha-tubulin suppressor-like RCC1 family protein
MHMSFVVRGWSMLALALACTPRGVEDTQPVSAERVERLEPTPKAEPTPKPEPTHEPVSGITEVAAGVHHACAKRDGRVYCWGLNRRGILGVGTDAPSLANQPDTVVVPTPVIGLELLGEIVTLDLDYDFACVLTASGEVHCWGENDVGQLGTGDQLSRSQPTKVEGLPVAARLDVSFGKVCATSERGKVWCWGSGEFGDGPRRHAQLEPIEVGELSGAEQLADACLLRRGKVSCWGTNAGGQVGNGEGGCEYDGPLCPHSKCLPEKTCKRVDTPVAALDLAGVVELDVGGHQRYARMPDGVVWQWGQTGYTMSSEPRDIYRPRPRDDLPKMVEVSAGGSHACARTEAGELWCWGNDSFGQLGFAQIGRDGEEGPRVVAGLPKVRAISAGFYFTCALVGEGEPEVWCWGDNGNGQLGDGTIDRRFEPAPVRW